MSTNKKQLDEVNPILDTLIKSTYDKMIPERRYHFYMARKGQKFYKYSSELKQEIMNKYKNGKGTINSLSKEYNIPINTMRTWQRKIAKNIDITIDNKHKKGRKKEENIDYKERYEILKKYQAFLKAQREKK